MSKQNSSSYDEFYQEALGERMLWLKIDTDMMRDPKVRRLQAHAKSLEMDEMTVRKYALSGMYVAAILHMAEMEDHAYDLSDSVGWSFFADDMGMSEEDAMTFVTLALGTGLFDREMFEESAKLSSERLAREADETARSKASARAKAAAMRSSKAKKP